MVTQVRREGGGRRDSDPERAQSVSQGPSLFWRWRTDGEPLVLTQQPDQCWVAWFGRNVWQAELMQTVARALNGLANLRMQHGASARGYPAEIAVLCFAEEDGQSTLRVDDRSRRIGRGGLIRADESHLRCLTLRDACRIHPLRIGP